MQSVAQLGFHFVDRGPRDGLPVLFLHAFPLHSGMWDAQVEALESERRCLAFDVRGFGKSPVSASPMMLEHVVDDLFALLDHLGVSRAVLCGLSMGGYVALRASEREPSRVAGLFLADTQAAADGNEAKLRRAEGVRKLEREGVEAYAQSFLPQVLSANAEHPDAVRAHARRLVLDSSAQGIAGGLLALATRTDTSMALSRIGAPTHVVVGADDVTTPASVARALAHEVPGARCVVIPRAGHLSNLDAPAAFNRELVAYLQTVA
jgi:3-oxoadipate enol-lactonase